MEYSRRHGGVVCETLFLSAVSLTSAPNALTFDDQSRSRCLDVPIIAQRLQSAMRAPASEVGHASQSEFRVWLGGLRSGVPLGTLTHLLPSGKRIPGAPKVSYLPTSKPTLPSVLGEKSMLIVSPSLDTLPSSFHTSFSSGTTPAGQEFLPPGRVSTPLTYATGLRPLRPSGPSFAPTTLTLRKHPGCFGSSYSP